MKVFAGLTGVTMLELNQLGEEGVVQKLRWTAVVRVALDRAVTSPDRHAFDAVLVADLEEGEIGEDRELSDQCNWTLGEVMFVYNRSRGTFVERRQALCRLLIGHGVEVHCV